MYGYLIVAAVIIVTLYAFYQAFMGKGRVLREHKKQIKRHSAELAKLNSEINEGVLRARKARKKYETYRNRAKHFLDDDADTKR